MSITFDNELRRCPRCGALLTMRYCNVCGADSQDRRQTVPSRIWLWARSHPRYAIWVAIAVVAAGFAAVDENVEFFEKHFPKLNAAIHGGEITSEGDAAYQGTKWGDDVRILEADIVGHGWNAVRTEMLRRKPYLDDLVERNDKIQRRLKIEADNHLDQNDACESLAIREAGPVMDEYTKLEQRMYSLLVGTTTPTDEDEATLKEIADQEVAVGKRLTEYGEHSHANGCDK